MVNITCEYTKEKTGNKYITIDLAIHREMMTEDGDLDAKDITQYKGKKASEESYY